MYIVAIVSLAITVSIVDSTNCTIEGTTVNCGCRNSETVPGTIELVCVITNVNQIQTLSTSNYSPNVSKLVLRLDGIATLPRSLISFSNLTTLSISGHNLTSVEEDAFLHVEGSLLNLYLTDTQLRSAPMTAIYRLGKLRLLHIENNLFSALDDSLQTMSLKHLIASSNNISAIRRGIFPQTLGFLDLSNNKISTMNGALREKLPTLTTIRISNNSFISLCGMLEGTPSLARLFADRNKIVTIDDGSLAMVPGLKVINLSFNNIREVDSGLRRLHQLKSLDLSHNRIDYLGRDAFQDCVALETLYLQRNEIDDKYDTLFNPLACLHTLDISYNHLSKLNFLTPLIRRIDEHQDPAFESETSNCTSLKYLDMAESGVVCNGDITQTIQLLQSKGVHICGNPCRTETEN